MLPRPASLRRSLQRAWLADHVCAYYVQVQNADASESHEPGVRGRQRRNGIMERRLETLAGLREICAPLPHTLVSSLSSPCLQIQSCMQPDLSSELQLLALPQLGPGHWTAASDCYPLHPCSDPSPQEPRHTPSHGCSSIQITEMMSRQPSMSVDAKHTVSAAAGGSWLAARASSNSTLFTAWPVAAEPPSVRPDDTPADTTRGLMWLSGAAHDVCRHLFLSSPT